MINVLLVDDEPVICQGLRFTIPWEEYDVKIVGEAHDGKEALELIKSHRAIDIVLLDVMMPVMDGLELAEQLHKLKFPPKIIMISGYEEFAYAKKAMRLGVKDYLLKPVDIDELLRTVKALVKETKNEKVERKAIHELQLTNVLKQQLTHSKKKDISEVAMRKHVLPILSSIQDYMSYTQGMSEEDISALEKSCKDGIGYLLHESGIDSVSFFVENNVLLTAAYSDHEKMDRKQIKRLLMNKKEIDCLYVVIGEPFPIQQFSEYFPVVRDKLRDAIIMRRKYNFTGEAVHEFSESYSYPVEQENKMIHALFSSDKKVLFSLVQELFREFSQSGIWLEKAFQYCRQMAEKVISSYQKITTSKNLQNLSLHVLQEADVVNEYNAYDLLQKLFMEDMNKLLAIVTEEKDDNWLMMRAQQYIKEFYNHKIKAYEVADYINISPNYFSALFKQQVGISFNEYLNEIRIEKAKVLLRETSDQVSLIAKEIGYQEYKYFAQIFKRITNVTPTEYRNMQKD